MDGLSRLIPTKSEPLEDRVTASLQAEVEIKKILYNTVWDLSVMEEIKIKH